MYDEGLGVEQDYEEAVNWYRKSAEQGNAGAQQNLGFTYKWGHGVEQSDEEAVSWFRKAAEQGDWQSQFVLGVMWVLGIFN